MWAFAITISEFVITFQVLRHVPNPQFKLRHNIQQQGCCQKNRRRQRRRAHFANSETDGWYNLALRLWPLWLLFLVRRKRGHRHGHIVIFIEYRPSSSVLYFTCRRCAYVLTRLKYTDYMYIFAHWRSNQYVKRVATDKWGWLLFESYTYGMSSCCLLCNTRPNALAFIWGLKMYNFLVNKGFPKKTFYLVLALLAIIIKMFYLLLTPNNFF